MRTDRSRGVDAGSVHSYRVSIGDDETVLDLDSGKGAYCC